MKMPWQGKPVDALEEHRVSLPGLEVSISHILKIVWVVDQTGSEDTYELEQLEKWVNAQGYSMHCVVVSPEKPPATNKE